MRNCRAPSWKLLKAAILDMDITQPHGTAAVDPESREYPISRVKIESARSHDDSVNAGAKPPPNVGKFGGLTLRFPRILL